MARNTRASRLAGATLGVLLATLGSGSGTLAMGTSTAPQAAATNASLSIIEGSRVAAGTYHSCALHGNGTVTCWGYNGFGQLGNGTNTVSSTQVPVTGLTNAVGIAAGEYFTCALRADQTVRCWGYNSDGELGNGSTEDSSTPVAVSGLTDAIRIAAGGSHACALRAGGAVVCWGYNGSGELGNNTTDNSSIPVTVSGLTDAVAIGVSAGDHSCAVRTGGTARCWGYNGDGQLGDGTFDDSSVPVNVSGVTDATAIVAGASHTCALRAGKTVICWGYNGLGELGDGTGDNSTSPVAVSGLTNVSSLAAGSDHTCAVRADGTGVCWGSNHYGNQVGFGGQLGNGTTTDALAPVAVSGLTGATAIGGGDWHTCALGPGETIRCWGANFFGELGDGSTTEAHSPVTVATAPGAPTTVLATAGDASALVSWTAPASNGGLAITGYTVTSDPDGKTCTWTTGPLSCTVGGLTNGTSYTFTVSATNAVGTGEVSTASDAVTPMTVPGAPSGVTAAPGDGQADVSWTAPALNGGSAITGYTATSTPDGKTCSWTTGALSCTISGLTNGTAYTFNVTATNIVGTGASGTSLAVTPRTVPGAPTGVTASPGDGQALVSWSTPASNGGSAITGYTATSDPGGKTCTTAGLSCTVSGLTNGTAYTFTVKATNVAGEGLSSTASTAVTPAASVTVPGAPTGVAATPADASANVSWTAPASNGGSAITGYTATSDPGGKTCTTAGLSCTVNGLTNGTAYTFTVKATNVAGPGAASGTSLAVTPRTVPGSPTGVTASPGDGQALVSWSAPASNGGSAITGYTATSDPGGKTCTTAGLSCTISGLTNGTAYTFTVKATNVAGNGSASTASAPVTPSAVIVRPTARITALAMYRNTTTVPLSWGATAGSAPVTSYDIRYRRAPWNGSFGGYTTWLTGTATTSGTFTGGAGNTYCFSVIAHAADGGVSTPTAETCTIVPLDERSLSRSGSWSTGTSSAYYKNTYSRSSSSGARLTRTGVVAKRIAIVATTCSTCGKVRVYWGSTLLKTISLYSRTTVNKKLITVTTFSSTRSGTLSLRVYGSGHRVLIDGVAIGRN